MRLVVGDITTLAVDAILTSDNSALSRMIPLLSARGDTARAVAAHHG
jgi:hypothetical protein